MICARFCSKRRLASRFAIVALALLSLGLVPRDAGAQTADAALMACAAATRPSWERTPGWDSKDSAERAASQRLWERRIDSLKTVGQGCMRGVDVAGVSDGLLDSLASVQARSGMHDQVPATVRRLMRSSLPLEARYKRAVMSSWQVYDLPRELSPIFAALIPMADSLHDIKVAAEARLTYAKSVRRIDSLGAYQYIRVLMLYLASQDSAGRSAAWDVANSSLYSIREWAIADGKASRAGGMADTIAAMYAKDSIYPNIIVPAARQTASVNMRAVPVESRYWLNSPGGTRRRDFAMGRVTLIEFTASWCSSCKPSYVPLQAMSQALGSRGFDVLFLVPGDYEGGPGRPVALKVEDSTITQYKTLFAHYGVTFPVMLTESAKYDLLYGVNSVPHFILIDKRGVIRDTWLSWGSNYDQTVREKVERLLAE
jgi:thiol-disulfide isomerase/thioredoxin